MSDRAPGLVPGSNVGNVPQLNVGVPQNNRVEPRTTTSPIPASVRKKMSRLESWQSSKGWRILKNVGAGLLGAGVALALASNPVGWAIAGTVLGVGAVAALTGTIMKARADFARIDVDAYQKGLETGQTVEHGSKGAKAWALTKSLAESAGFAIMGFFAGAGIGGVFRPEALHGVIGAKQTLAAKASTTVNGVALSAIYGAGTVGLSVPGFRYDKARNAVPPDLKYRDNITHGPKEYRGTLKTDVPKRAGSYPYFEQQRTNAKNAPRDERNDVTVTGGIASHLHEVDQRARTHAVHGANNFPGQRAQKVTVHDRELLARMSQQNFALINGHMKGSGYAVKTIPTDEPLFASGPPRIDDISQSHRRLTCYLMAALAAAVARPGGSAKIEKIMNDNGDGTVTVRLPKGDVTVDKTRIVTDDGYNVFNSGANWVHILEKAIAASELNTIPNSDATNNFDQGRFEHGVRMLEHLFGPANENPARLNVTATRRFGQMDNRMTVSNTQDEWHEVIDRSLAQGLPVAFYTNDDDEDEDTARMMQQRVIPDHTYPVVGHAVRNGQQGYLVYDPYGTNVGPFPTNTGNNNAMTLSRSQRGYNSVFFVSRAQALQIFDHVAYSKIAEPPFRPRNNNNNNEMRV